MQSNVQNTNIENSSIEIDMKRIGRVILKNLWKIAIVAVLFGSIALFISYQFMTPMYRTTISFHVANKLQYAGVDSNISLNDLDTSSNLVYSYVELLRSRQHLSEAVTHSGLNISHNQLNGMISTATVNETGVFKVTISSDDPQEVVTLGNSVAYVVEEKICKNILKGSTVTLVDAAVKPTAPYSPNHITNTLTGFGVGLFVSIGFIVLLEIFDSKIKTEEELKRCGKYPILTIVPDMNESSRRGYYKKHYGHYGHYAESRLNTTTNGNAPGIIGSELDFATSEAYKLLRTKLQYSVTDNCKCQVFVVSSAIPGEGKSVTSINLAYSFSQLGKRVLLIDGDMRRPTLAAKLNISNYPGLSECLTGLIDLDELLQEHKEGTECTFNVLTAGSIPPNPIELIDSAKMEQVINQLREKFDYIVVDMPPVGDVSDALVASKYADGILIITRYNYCTRSALNDAIQQFEFVDAKILGTVFNCFGDKSSKYNYHKYYQQQNGRQPVDKIKKTAEQPAEQVQ